MVAARRSPVISHIQNRNPRFRSSPPSPSPSTSLVHGHATALPSGSRDARLSTTHSVYRCHCKVRGSSTDRIPRACLGFGLVSSQAPKGKPRYWVPWTFVRKSSSTGFDMPKAVRAGCRGNRSRRLTGHQRSLREGHRLVPARLASLPRDLPATPQRLPLVTLITILIPLDSTALTP